MISVRFIHASLAVLFAITGNGSKKFELEVRRVLRGARDAMDLPSKAYRMTNSIDHLGHELELWVMTRSEINQAAAEKIVFLLMRELAQIAASLRAPTTTP